MALGAYVLGGLNAADRAAFEGHLAGCAACRAELRESAALPDLLNAVPPSDAFALARGRPGWTQEQSGGRHGPEHGPAHALGRPAHVGGRGHSPADSAPLAGLMARLATQRRRGRRRSLAFASAAAGVALVAGFLLAPLAQTEPPPDAMYSVSSAAGLEMELGLDRRAWGTELAFSGSNLPTSGTLSLWTVALDGNEDRAGSWTATQTGKSRIIGAVPLQLDGIAEIELRDAEGRVLAVVKLAAGDSASL